MFTKPLPRWGGDAVEPPEQKKTDGYLIGDRPPAQWENWLRKTTYEALEETQNNVETTADDFTAHKADYAYQTPMIVGTQIQLAKQSDTARLYFKLDAYLDGGGITISLDSGTTEKPLLDIEGEPITELEKGFVEVVEDSVNFTLRPRGGVKLEKINDLRRIFETDDYTSSIDAIDIDKEFVYFGGQAGSSIPRTIRKHRKSDLSFLTESGNFGGNIRAIAVDDTHIYAVGNAFNTGSTSRLRKYNKNTMELVSETPNYAQIMYSVVVDGEFVYVGGRHEVLKYSKSDLSLVGQSVNNTSISFVYTIRVDDNNIFIGGDSNDIRKFNKVDLSLVSQTSYGNIVNSLQIDDFYLYVGGRGNKVKKYLKTNLSFIEESQDFTSEILNITIDDEFVYAGGVKQIISRYTKNGLNFLENSTQISDNTSFRVTSIASDDEHIYIGGVSFDPKVRKFTKFIYNFKGQILIPTGEEVI